MNRDRPIRLVESMLSQQLSRLLTLLWVSLYLHFVLLNYLQLWAFDGFPRVYYQIWLFCHCFVFPVEEKKKRLVRRQEGGKKKEGKKKKIDDWKRFLFASHVSFKVHTPLCDGLESKTSVTNANGILDSIGAPCWVTTWFFTSSFSKCLAISELLRSMILLRSFLSMLTLLLINLTCKTSISDLGKPSGVINWVSISTLLSLNRSKNLESSCSTWLFSWNTWSNGNSLKRSIFDFRSSSIDSLSRPWANTSNLLSLFILCFLYFLFSSNSV